MYPRLIVFLLVTLSFVVLPVTAHAERAPARSVFALVVTSNKSQKLSRPDLHYADDDGARYYELFRTMAPEANVTLLTTLDRDSAKLFPDLAEKIAPPQKGQVLAAFGRLTQQVREAVARKERADFYFVFAGHGDVDDGKGFLELADGKIVSDELTSLIASVPATRSHVILDSCNSFFVINARKPGGRRFATAAEAGERLNRSLPNVGVFLSTSAEAETFEWSELGAGIFSHAVRSGLSGAADANGDGEVSYDELAAFVHTAARDVKNPRYRPSVFARGPSGRGGEPLLDLSAARAAKLTLPKGAGRVSLRDADDLPWIDAHVEPGAEVSLHVPERIAAGAVVELGTERRTIERTADGGLVLATATSPVKLAARGAGDLFKSLFMRPFGPKALAQYKDEVSSEPPPVYGVATDDVVRMNELLWHASENARSQRYLQALGFTAAGGAYVGLGVYQLTEGRGSTSAVPFIAAGSVPLVFAGWSALRTSREEDAFAWFSRERARNGASPDLMAGAEARLFALARKDREERMFWRWFGIAYGGASVLAQTGLAIHSAANDWGDTYLFGATAFISAFAYGIPVIGTFTPTYTERMAEIWARDPSRARLEAKTPSSFSVKPLVGGTFFGLSGTF